MSYSSNKIDANHSHSLLIEDPDEELISDHFICCVCLDLFYKPIVLACGHVSCFWCVHKSMDPLRASHCPICRNPYHHFPTICEMLHFLIMKMYPLAYKRREKQILEEEKKMACFSPQLDGQELKDGVGCEASRGANSMSDMPSAPCIAGQDEDCFKVNDEGSAASKQNNQPVSDDGRTCRKVSCADLLCPACKQLLYCPVVLNCGHVYCDACILVPEDGVIICKICEIPNPSECPNVCLELNKFLEEQFSEEYAKRKENVEHAEAHFQHKNSSSGSGSKKSSRNQCMDSEDLFQWNNLGSKVHVAAGCDYCGMYPIAGDRYKCKDCVESMGFDLCGDCYNTRSKRPGRFNQQHTQDHQFELLKPPDNSFSSLMLRLVQGNLVDSSEAPVLAFSVDEDSSDGWIAVEPSAALQNFDGSSMVPDGSNGDDMYVETQDGSTRVEYNVAPETAIDYDLSRSLHNHESEDSSSEA